ncbi:MAG: ABC transporter permease [Rhodospirillales bacterium]|nr:ABC transporter permease [Rhodospirillales bacterium]
MNEKRKRQLTKNLIALWSIFVIGFLYVPMIAVVLASFSKQRYFQFPISSWTLRWYEKASTSLSIRDLLWTSVSVALLVTLFSIILAFFGSLAFARYEWKGRKLYQRLILLPIFFPQAVLGLALLLWFSSIGIIPSWQTAVFAHMVWIVPIVTLIMSIQVYSFDPALEEAAFDLGATRLQVLREITLPILSPGIVSGGLFAFLLSWGNFPLSMFTTGADQTVPEWLYSKMVSGYTPMVPTLGSFTMGSAASVLIIIYLSWMVFRHKSFKLNQSSANKEE